MKGRMQAALVVASFAVLAALLPPIAAISGGALALVTLRRGIRDGVWVTAIAATGGAALSWLALGSPQFVLIVLLGIWAPTLAISMVLRSTVSLSVALRFLAILATLPVLAIFVALGDPTAWWLELMTRAAPVVLEELGAQVPVDLLEQQIALLAPRFTGVLVSQGIAIVLSSLLLGRWWQAQLYNPGGFGEEFRSLNLGKPFAIAVLILYGLAMLGGIDLLTNLTIAMSMVLAMFGLAIVHALVHLAKAGRGWLVTVYVLLGLLMFPAMTLLSVLGAADVWLGIRDRFARRPGGGQ
jgi:hypothetical protein